MYLLSVRLDFDDEFARSFLFLAIGKDAEDSQSSSPLDVLLSSVETSSGDRIADELVAFAAAKGSSRVLD